MVADAIREKGGTADALSFPSGFAAAVKALLADEDTTIEDSIVGGKVMERYENNRVTYALPHINAGILVYQGIKSIGHNWRNGTDYNLKKLDLRNCASIGISSVLGQRSLTDIRLDSFVSAGSNSLGDLPSLKKLDLPSFQTYANGGRMGYGAASLKTLILRRSDAIVPLTYVAYIQDTLIASGEGYVYVPAALIEEYKAATNWAAYADQFRAIEDYPDETAPMEDF